MVWSVYASVVLVEATTGQFGGLGSGLLLLLGGAHGRTGCAGGSYRRGEEEDDVSWVVNLLAALDTIEELEVDADWLARAMPPNTSITTTDTRAIPIPMDLFIPVFLNLFAEEKGGSTESGRCRMDEPDNASDRFGASLSRPWTTKENGRTCQDAQSKKLERLKSQVI
jgi:hypothetical protein